MELARLLSLRAKRFYLLLVAVAVLELVLVMVPVAALEELEVPEYQEQVVPQQVERLEGLEANLHSQDVLLHMILLEVKVATEGKVGVMQQGLVAMPSMAEGAALAHTQTTAAQAYMEQVVVE